MTDLRIVVEGPTEFAFVNAVLAPHLDARSVYTTPIVVATKRERDGRKRRGGGDWSKWERDIRNLLQDGRADLRVTTMFDLYGLPKNFPQLATHARVPDTNQRCALLEAAMGTTIGDSRFIPYLQRHEFEALVLAGLDALEILLDAPTDRAGLERLRRDIGAFAPEDVNDGRETAPSQRLRRSIPSYHPKDGSGGRKPVYGQLVTVETGLTQLRARCPRFDAWVTKLEQLAGETT